MTPMTLPLSDCCAAPHEGELIPDSAHPGTAFGVCSRCRHTALFPVEVPPAADKPEPALWVMLAILAGIVAAALFVNGSPVTGGLAATVTVAALIRGFRR